MAAEPEQADAPMDEPMDEDALMVILQQMLANKAAGPSEMRARVAAEVDVWRWTTA